MKAGGRLLRWAGAVLIALGAGHLSLLLLMSWDGVAGWARRGLWAAVPLTFDTGGQPASAIRDTLVFWAGPGSFAVPLILLGALIWRLAGRGTPVPAWLGWALAAWCALGGVLLVPSPYFAGSAAGLLVVLAARRRPDMSDRS
ncbi:DUF6463 family protein [Nonomuraea longicatena]|uniref:DUF6463 family protein n=1 Tax=Nonomuraea longicatena TaxID=83682 RepID=A0ABP4AQU8_9ACTN